MKIDNRVLLSGPDDNLTSLMQQKNPFLSLEKKTSINQQQSNAFAMRTVGGNTLLITAEDQYFEDQGSNETGATAVNI